MKLSDSRTEVKLTFSFEPGELVLGPTSMYSVTTFTVYVHPRWIYTARDKYSDYSFIFTMKHVMGVGHKLDGTWGKREVYLAAHGVWEQLPSDVQAAVADEYAATTRDLPSTLPEQR